METKGYTLIPNSKHIYSNSMDIFVTEYFHLSLTCYNQGILSLDSFVSNFGGNSKYPIVRVYIQKYAMG